MWGLMKVTEHSVVKRFLLEKSGAITLDWVALTSSVVVIGLGLVYMVYGGEDGPITEMITNYNAELNTAADNLVGGVGAPPPPLE